jgi:hypothetical protein
VSAGDIQSVGETGYRTSEGKEIDRLRAIPAIASRKTCGTGMEECRPTVESVSKVRFDMLRAREGMGEGEW